MATRPHDTDTSKVREAKERYVELREQVRPGNVTPVLLAELEDAYATYVRVRAQPASDMPRQNKQTE